LAANGEGFDIILYQKEEKGQIKRGAKAISQTYFTP
jgi:hypothetical protein